MDGEYKTVSKITAHISKLLKKDPELKTVYIKGELSNFKTYPSGHSYFTLKDKKSKIKSVMFKFYSETLKFKPENGMKVLIKGKIEVYSTNGYYQLYAHRMTEDGQGDLHIAFEQLKKKLDKEGLFDKRYKKQIPKFPKRIGVVTAQNGAAIRDIITTIKRRWPYCEILVFSTLVQGEGSAEQITRKIKQSENFNLDTLIVGRGGGSIEDLWSFNEEIVARAIYDCSIPVISAVGHEIDFTIADFTSDLRAPTPTAAGELAVPDKNEIKYKFNQLTKHLTTSMDDKIKTHTTRLNNITEKQLFKNPASLYEIKEMQLDKLISKINYTSQNIISKNKNKIKFIENSQVLKNPKIILETKKDKLIVNIDKLDILNPLLTIKRGYSLAKKDGKVISKVSDVKKDDEIEIEVSDGVINTKVI